LLRDSELRDEQTSAQWAAAGRGHGDFGAARHLALAAFAPELHAGFV
jgi:hypothetical protein